MSPRTEGGRRPAPVVSLTSRRNALTLLSNALNSLSPRVSLSTSRRRVRGLDAPSATGVRVPLFVRRRGPPGGRTRARRAEVDATPATLARHASRSCDTPDDADAPTALIDPATSPPARFRDWRRSNACHVATSSRSRCRVFGGNIEVPSCGRAVAVGSGTSPAAHESSAARLAPRADRPRAAAMECRHYTTPRRRMPRRSAASSSARLRKPTHRGSSSRSRPTSGDCRPRRRPCRTRSGACGTSARVGRTRS